MTAKSLAREALRNALNTRIEWANRYRNEGITIKKARKDLMHVTTQVLDFIGTNQEDLDKPRVYVRYTTDHRNLPEVEFVIREATGFKDDSVAMAMSYVMGIGFEAKGNTYENAEYLHREYRFERPDMAVCFEVRVKSDSPTCRKVKVGEETLKISKYEIECD